MEIVGLISVVIILAAICVPLFLILWLIFGGIAVTNKTKNLFAQGLMSKKIKNLAFSKVYLEFCLQKMRRI